MNPVEKRSLFYLLSKERLHFHYLPAMVYMAYFLTLDHRKAILIIIAVIIAITLSATWNSVGMLLQDSHDHSSMNFKRHLRIVIPKRMDFLS